MKELRKFQNDSRTKIRKRVGCVGWKVSQAFSDLTLFTGRYPPGIDHRVPSENRNHASFCDHPEHGC